MRTVVAFNGHDLTEHFAVSNLRTPLLPRSISTEDVPGLDGGIYTGSALQPRTITLGLTVLDNTIEGRQAASRALAATLAVDEPSPLSLSIDSGLYYLAMPTSTADGDRYRNANSFEVDFICPDPVAFGEERNVTVPSGGSVTFIVGGTYPTKPTVRAPKAKSAGSGAWRLSMENGDYLIVSAGSASDVLADCQQRVLKVNGVTKLLQPSADWLEFAPGEHTLTMSGTGEATVTFIERWL